MTANQPRQPRGVPTGGQWRATARPEGPGVEGTDMEAAPPANSRRDSWPLVHSDTWPGEKAVACPKCGSQTIAITSSNLGSDVVRGIRYRRFDCKTCGYREYFNT